jgi:uncharacterized protein
MTQATIIIAGTPNWAERTKQQLGDGYTIKQYSERAAGYVARLTDDRAAMILTDADGDEWRFWTTTPKTSPATRRVPVVAVSASGERRAEALVAGADFTLAPEDLPGQLPGLVKDFARVLDPAVIAALERECEGELPELGKQGIEKFNAGEYYPQHDLFEELWMATEGPVRNLYQAILQVGIGYYQITRGNYRGAHKMLLRSVQWLAVLPDVCQGVDVKQLRDDSYRVRAELERIQPEAIGAFDRSLLKPVKYRESS